MTETYNLNDCPIGGGATRIDGLNDSIDPGTILLLKDLCEDFYLLAD